MARLFNVQLPPHAQTDKGEDDDNDRGNRSPDGYSQDLPVHLALVSIIISSAGTHSRPFLYRALASVGAEVSRARLAVAPSLQHITRIPVTIARETLAGEATKIINTDTVVSTVVIFWLRTLVEIFDPRDGVEWSGNVKVSTSYVVGTGLYNFYQFVSDVTFHNFRFCVGILLHFYCGVYRHSPVHGEEFINFVPHVHIGEGRESHGRTNLKTRTYSRGA